MVLKRQNTSLRVYSSEGNFLLVQNNSQTTGKENIKDRSRKL